MNTDVHNIFPLIFSSWHKHEETHNPACLQVQAQIRSKAECASHHAVVSTYSMA
jgi:hypothetical protein